MAPPIPAPTHSHRLLSPPPSCDHPNADDAAGAAASLPQVRVRASAPAPSPPFQGVLFSFYMSMRPATLAPLDSNTLPIGIPVKVYDAGTKPCGFYFARLHTVPDPPQASRWVGGWVCMRACVHVRVCVHVCVCK